MKTVARIATVLAALVPQCALVWLPGQKTVMVWCGVNGNATACVAHLNERVHDLLTAVTHYAEWMNTGHT